MNKASSANLAVVVGAVLPALLGQQPNIDPSSSWWVIAAVALVNYFLHRNAEPAKPALKVGDLDDK